MENTGKVKSKRFLYFLITTLLLCAVFFFYIFFFKEIRLLEDRMSSNLEGEIYLTLSPSDEGLPNIYRLSLPSFELDPVFEKNEYSNYMPSFSSDLKKMVFVRSYEDRTSQILVFDEQTKETFEVTSRTEFFIRNPYFSLDNEKIVYWVYEEKQDVWTSGFDAEENDIYLVSLNGVEEKLTKGVYPCFGPGGENILFIKNDGLYSLNLLDKSEERVISLFNPDSVIPSLRDSSWGWENIKFTYSETDRVLLITDSIHGKVYVFQVNSLIPFEYSNMESFDSDSPNWPFFSPGQGIFLIQEIETEEPYSPVLSFFSLKNDLSERIKFFSLDNYFFSDIWYLNWINR